MIDNPLLSKQREKAGSYTFGKYSYQYHWALFKVISEHNIKSEYAVFMELHEDVVISSSLNKSEALFEFNQVKTNKGKFTTKNITKQKKKKPSVLGALINNCINKEYSDSIKKINLISTSGFSFELKNPEYDFEIIQVNDLNESCYNSINQLLAIETGGTGLPNNVQFIIPNLPEKMCQQAVIGEISRLVTELYPKSTCDSTHIYRLLYDELTNKGQNTFDYKEWNEALNKKALTSDTVNETINSFTSQDNKQELLTSFKEVLSELEINGFMRQHKYIKSFERYQIQRIGARNSHALSFIRKVTELLNQNADKCGDDIGTLILLVQQSLDKRTKSKFQKDEDLQVAIIYEFLKDKG